MRSLALLRGTTAPRVGLASRRAAALPLQRLLSTAPKDAFQPPENPLSPQSLDPNSLTTKVATATTKTFRELLVPLNEALRGPLDRKADDRVPMPFVLVVGNHSSGKSTFINYVLKRRVQEAGVAPTDDGFTIIASGRADSDKDGPALVGDPDLGFSGLSTFGSTLVHHTRLKVRKDIALQNVILIDSPGMIDSPQASDAVNSKRSRLSERGYDFHGVIRWLGERADIVLLFYDPDKPGTTGETLSVMTESLSGMDHKLLIVLNKVDLFSRSHDFARAYGSLCWNLSKVINRKDLPRIYTTATPLDTPWTSPSSNSQTQHTPPPANQADKKDWTTTPSRSDLDAARDEVVAEILNAPTRRLDNMITSLGDSVLKLKIHAEIIEDVRQEFQSSRRKAMLYSTLIGGSGVTLAVAAVAFLGPEALTFSGLMAVSGVTGGVGYSMWSTSKLEELAKSMVNDTYLDNVFRRRYARDLLMRDSSSLSVWNLIKPQCKAAIENFGVGKLPKVSASQLGALDAVLKTEIPTLRRMAAPSTLGAAGSLLGAPLSGLAARVQAAFGSNGAEAGETKKSAQSPYDK